jgi:hypothetical protein
MVTVHLTEAELAQDVHAALEMVRQGTEVVVEDDCRAVAVISTPHVKRRMISEVIAALKEGGSTAVVDDDKEQWDPPPWA